MQYLLETVLKNGRVSAQSLGLACATAAVDLAPWVLPSLSPVTPFTTAGDPKLRNRAVKVPPPHLLCTHLSIQFFV